MPVIVSSLAGIGLSLSVLQPMEMTAPDATSPRIEFPDLDGLRNVRMPPFNAKGDGETDDTAAIQAAIDSGYRVYIPAGVYLIDPRIGLSVHTGTQIIGEGRFATILLAMPFGGSHEQLASYGPGSIIRRQFKLGRPNGYVSFVRLADFAVVLNHPIDRVTVSDIQIGIDLRNVTRSMVERVHVGNIRPDGSRRGKRGQEQFDSQGYGIVLGTVSSGLQSYAGGELNIVDNASVWGTFKGIVQDDSTLSPNSAAHGSNVLRSDIQSSHILLSQESRHAHAFAWRDNVLQNIVPQPGATLPPGALAIAGQDASVAGGYVEPGSADILLVRLGDSSRNISIDFAYVGCKKQAPVSDSGTGNRIDYSGFSNCNP